MAEPLTRPSRGTQPEPLPFPAAAFSPPKSEEPEAVRAEVCVFIYLLSIQLLAQENEDQLQLTATGLVFRMKVCVLCM